jgi:hypothetical protein
MAKGRKLAINNANEVLRTTFNGLPIVDAEADFSLIVRNTEVKAAKGMERDASNCILAKACAKQVGATIVAFLRTVAYLELPDGKGNKRVVRYMLDEDSQAIVKAFDRGKAVRGEVMVTLKAPRASDKLDYIREESRLKAARERKAAIRGEITGNNNPRMARYQSKRSVKDMDVRNGTGLVQNMIKKTH